MDDRMLHSLLIILKCGSMSSAANQLNCTQSAVTQRMNALEDELGFKVLERTNRGIKLTENGKRILPFIRDADNAVSALKKESKGILANDHPVIKLGTHASIGNSWLFDLLNAYLELYPDTRFELTVGSTDLGMDLRKNNLDICIGNEFYFHGFSYFPIMEDEIFAVFPESYIPEDMESITRPQLNRFHVLRSPVNPVFNNNYFGNIFNGTYDNETFIYAEDDNLIMRMVAAKQGVTILPRLSLINPPPGLRIVKLDPPLKRKIVIAFPKKSSHRVVRFAKFTIEYFKNKEFPYYR